MAKIRFALRGKATMLMGKNTMMRKVISTYIKDHPGHPYEQVSVDFPPVAVFLPFRSLPLNVKYI